MPEDFLQLHLKALPYFRALLRSIEATFYQDLELPSPILDMGCGDGHFGSVTFDRKIDIGVDPDLPSLQEAQTRQAYHSLIQSDGAILPLPAGSIASAFSNSVLEHIPHLDRVLAELGRVMRTGAPLVFTVPNPGYRSELSFPRWLTRMRLPGLAERYTEWFMRMSRTWNMFYEPGWQERLQTAGFEIERTFRYFSPRALSVLEWGHYFGAPTLLPRKLTGRWIIAPTNWNLALTDRIVRQYYEEPRTEHGTYSFYLARRI
ncbi:MAG: class I SAM-dependent methyltransferase [Anaerolineales bacterium]|jgi:SAM-dependent methyltransferase